MAPEIAPMEVAQDVTDKQTTNASINLMQAPQN